MNSIKIYLTGITGLLFGGMLFVSCVKTFDEKTVQQTNFNNSTLVQVYIAAVNASRNYVYVDGQPVNGASLISGGLFPATGPGFSIPGGVKAFLIRDTLSTSTQIPLSFAENMQVAKKYTVFLYDTTTAPKQRTVETTIIIPADTSARLRFANFVYTPTGITAFDVFSVKKNANIFTNVQITDVTSFIPYPSGVTDTFYLRPTGTATNLQNFRPSPAGFVNVQAVLNPTQKRSYTLVFRGGYRATATNNTTVRTLSAFIDY